MSLLREIQASLVEGQKIGPILLKLRLLASRLGSETLEEWVKHESEGYPPHVDLPDYRKIPVSYTGTFSGAFGSAIKNAPIPSYLVEKFAGPHWNSFQMRQSVAAVDELIGSGKESGGSLHINASNLILLLQGNVYEDYACNSVTGTISAAALTEIQNAVRTKILELTIQIEKSIPSAVEIGLGSPTTNESAKDPERVTQITHQVINGNVTSISNVGDGAQFSFNNSAGDGDAFVKALVKAGIAKPDAQEFAKIVASEKPESNTEPFGVRAKAWIVDNIGKAANGTWKAGMAVATNVLTEAALRYYGLK
ncbi:AbiTii domain-containing protein [Bradyrhizobium cenepequi]|uniref:AbiTii domain-containing protein n=1 Tax=Bradyrhizobium cenepequi TaxID=2821403 RepID=UPI001CE3B455|nr:hypothetical protein [Bradyrhizobium cenepequi]MCA6112759.1 hypothetical protein [Bradyrhizobium cenepequi]